MNVYYDTEEQLNAVGLVNIGELDQRDLSYEYNTLIVLRHDPTGRLFYAADAGCSCPTPFEGYSFTGPDDTNMDEITMGDSFESFRREVEQFPAEQSERDEVISAVQSALKASGHAVRSGTIPPE